LDAAEDPATSIAAYRAGIRARNRWLANGEAPWVKGGLAVAKRHRLRAAYRVSASYRQKNVEGRVPRRLGVPAGSVDAPLRQEHATATAAQCRSDWRAGGRKGRTAHGSGQAVRPNGAPLRLPVLRAIVTTVCICIY